MKEIERIRIDGLADLFEEYGVSATREQIVAIAKGFADGIDMEREWQSYAYAGPHTHKCDKCESKDLKIKELESIISRYEKGIEKHKNADAVWLEGNTIVYRSGSGREYEIV